MAPLTIPTHYQITINADQLKNKPVVIKAFLTFNFLLGRVGIPCFKKEENEYYNPEHLS